MLRETDGFKTGIKIAVLASGNGSNLGALIEASNSSKINNAEIILVISDREQAYALTRAKEAGISALYFRRSLFNSDEDYDLNIIKSLREHNTDIVLLAGYMRIVTRPFLESYENRILNIHPSLLPEFGGRGMYGMNVHRAVIDAKKEQSGCSVHLVTEEIDGGRIVGQACVPVFPEDTPEILAARILKEEHKLYPTAVNRFIEDLR